MACPKFHSHALNFTVLARCPVSRARVSRLELPHGVVDTPVFMPVGTQGSIKGLLPVELERLDCRIILANTYHLGTRPGAALLRRAGGLHRLMSWRRALLTDSGGFQMVSLLQLAEINERGVQFSSPFDGRPCLLTPEHSVEIQNAIGADIIMQLDDVVHSSTTGERLDEAMRRTTRWLDRSLAAHARPHDQNLFPIVQGGLDERLRAESGRQLTQRDVAGFAIGGLSGGESKAQFWRMVALSTGQLPENKPRYLMGVGAAVDLVVCVALGCDMFDCVFPTRTARFGCALRDYGQLDLRLARYAADSRPIDAACSCDTCSRYSRAYLHAIVTRDTTACHMVSLHNLHYQLQLMARMRQSISAGEFPQFAREFMQRAFDNTDYPAWVVEALQSVNIQL